MGLGRGWGGGRTARHDVACARGRVEVDGHRRRVGVGVGVSVEQGVGRWWV